MKEKNENQIEIIERKKRHKKVSEHNVEQKYEKCWKNKIKLNEWNGVSVQSGQRERRMTKSVTTNVLKVFTAEDPKAKQWQKKVIMHAEHK